MNRTNVSLVMEKGIDPDFFNKNGAAAAEDEDAFCEVLGDFKCGLLLEQRYLTYITEKDIDLFASYGVNLLRVPIGYWAFMFRQQGMHYHTGGQLLALARISQYAIRKGMHVIIDLHGLPGGQNGLDNQGKTGQLTWWNNDKNFDDSIKMVNLATDWIKWQPNSDQFTLSLINEPLPALYYFGQTDASFAYLNKYYNASLAAIRKKSKTLPVMLSDGFAGEKAWEQWWPRTDLNIVWDSHIYFFQDKAYSYDAPYSACYLAKSYAEAINPVFIGEWSIQAGTMNHLGDNSRKMLFQTQLQAYTGMLAGGAFWNAKHKGPNVVGDDGSQQYFYWSWEQLASEGIVPKAGEVLDVATC
jgi:aryl-phospho-beta-D-glucosidase BglC (GH1 family)